MNLIKKIYNIYHNITIVILLPKYLKDYLKPEVGKEYNVGVSLKLKILFRFMRNNHKITTASNWAEHLELAKCILTIPKRVKGDVIECGSYMGGSSANLSILCSIVKRKLIVCDSFEGLPPVKKTDKRHSIASTGRIDEYAEGMFCGNLKTVKKNIKDYGDIKSCVFVKGWFDDTLPKLDKTFVVAFVDVDLKESLKTCIINIWPKLVKGGRMYCHEAEHLNNVSLFFNPVWWNKYVSKEKPPGFVGAGTGLPLFIGSNQGSSIGFANKL